MIRKKVVVGLSGGVDSSAALWLLKEQGYQAMGVTLKLPVWKTAGDTGRIKAAKIVCQKLCVPHQVIDCRTDFQRLVVDYFVSEFKSGRTPNPCVICNKKLKFPKLLEFAKKQGADLVATGHYAKVVAPPRLLLRAKDKNKDQSYFLAMLGQKELKRLIFPLGDYTKEQAYEIAKKQGYRELIQRHESQDFCYLANQDKNRFLENRLAGQSGPIVDQKGKVLGQHRGLHFYTRGQRHGLGLNGGVFHVLKLDTAGNKLIVTKNKKGLYQKEVIMSNWNFISNQSSKKAIKVKAKTRSTQPLQPATLYPPKNKRLRLVFNQPQFAITPGQFAVFYSGQTCLGGGEIAS